MVEGSIVIKFENEVPYPIKGHLNSRLECSSGIIGLFRGMKLEKVEDASYLLSFHHFDMEKMIKDLEFVKKYSQERRAEIKSITIHMEGLN